MSDVMTGIQHKARDHARSPIAWTSGPNGGFTSPEAKPWMRMDEGDRQDWNVEKQVREQDVDRTGEQSVFGFWKQTIAFRKANPACVSPLLLEG